MVKKHVNLGFCSFFWAFLKKKFEFICMFSDLCLYLHPNYLRGGDYVKKLREKKEVQHYFCFFINLNFLIV